MVGVWEDGRWELMEGPPHLGEGVGWERPILRFFPELRSVSRTQISPCSLCPPPREDTEVAGPASQGGEGAQRPAE